MEQAIALRAAMSDKLMTAKLIILMTMVSVTAISTSITAM